MQIPVITVDGPSGVGKGTLSAQLTAALSWNFLDSGALYRLTGLHAERRRVTTDDCEGLRILAEELPAEFLFSGQSLTVLLDGEDVSDLIRTEEVGRLASQVAPVREVRDALLQRQRDFRRAPGLVADGRDMGTTVFPDAVLKFFLTASAEERAKRRYIQLKNKGSDVSIARLAEDIRERDERDSSRAISPLLPAEDAIVIDSTDLSIEGVLEEVMKSVKSCPALHL